MFIVNGLSQPVSRGPESHVLQRFDPNVINKFGPDYGQIKKGTKVILTLSMATQILVRMSNGTPLKAASGSEALALDARRDDQRLHIAVPVKIFPDLKSFESHTCCTYEISPNGARVAMVPGIKQVGQLVFVQRLNRRARYKVAWIGEPHTSQAGQVGVESLEPANVIWETEIKARLKQLLAP